jgi:hypothetical protein
VLISLLVAQKAASAAAIVAPATRIFSVLSNYISAFLSRPRSGNYLAAMGTRCRYQWRTPTNPLLRARPGSFKGLAPISAGGCARRRALGISLSARPRRAPLEGGPASPLLLIGRSCGARITRAPA